jgi:pimeloyl-ACP methyl ester carboxylesterase
MDLPDIHFATTSDGVTIAWWSIGSGPPLILTHNFGLSHAELEWTVPSIASFYRTLADGYRLIRFDPRHSGLSENRDDLDMTLAAMGHDISAVADAAGADSFALFAVATMGPVAIEYAASHPERVGHLILCDTYARVTGTPHARRIEAQEALARVGGPVTGAMIMREVAPPDEVEEILSLVAAARGPSSSGGRHPAEEWDAAGRLDYVRAPTLVIVGRDSKVSGMGEGREMATGIPGAQLKSMGGSFLPYGNQPATFDALTAFMGKPLRATGFLPALGFTTVVFTDLVASTELMTRLGDAKGRALLRAIEQTTSDLAHKNGGRVIKYTGDGAMAAFPSTSGALSFAVDLQEATADTPTRLRIGMAAGEPIDQDGDLYGAVVHQASRVADQAAAGEIVVADSVRQLALGKGFSFEPAGETALKGFNEPVRLWRVGSDG